MLQILGLIIVALCVVIFGYQYFKPRQISAMTLEAQIQTLSEIGIALNDGVSIDDLLNSFDREQYEDRPFDLALSIYGAEVESEPWGRNFCDQVWDFDTEAIEGDGAYVDIVNRLALVAGRQDCLTEVKDSINMETGIAWVSYKIDGKPRKHDAHLNDDWADPTVVSAIMNDLETPGMKFYAKDNGQASVWFYLSSHLASKINKLTGNALKAAD